jgi:hypothetical protein
MLVLAKGRSAVLRQALVVAVVALTLTPIEAANADSVQIDTASDVQVEVTIGELQANIWGAVVVSVASPITCMNNATRESHTSSLPILLKEHVRDAATFERMSSMLLAAHLARRSVTLQLTGYQLTNGQKYCSIYRVILK